MLLREGEAYRRSLADRVAKVGMEDHVQFVNRFVGKGELTQWLQAADVFVTPYPNMAQIVSGTLSYAMGAGRAVVSTPYAYAAELLADGRGVLVPPGSAVGFATAINTVLGDPELRAAIGRRAYAHTRGMVWSAVGAQYRSLFAEVIADAPAALPVAAPVHTTERAPQLAAARG
jgi:glycosyltransferase involved in cell wall biosynthesis